MSAEIRDWSLGYGPHVLEPLSSGRVNFCAKRNDGNAILTATMDRADFLAAISSELGVVIIDKADLPEVEETGLPQFPLMVRGQKFPAAVTAETCRQIALDHLALAEHMDAHPPVDEAQVEALAEVIAKMTPTLCVGAYIGADLTPSDVARAIIATGKVEVRS